MSICGSLMFKNARAKRKRGWAGAPISWLFCDGSVASLGEIDSIFDENRGNFHKPHPRLSTLENGHAFALFFQDFDWFNQRWLAQSARRAGLGAKIRKCCSVGGFV